MKRVAITGNIGSGKTWVSQLFAERLGIPVFDSDRETKLLYGRPDVVEAMQARFGDGLYAPDGTLHNARLAQLLFDDPDTPENELEYGLPLPATVPAVKGDNMLFIYQQYEIAAYALGLPCVSLPLTAVKDCLTEEGKRYLGFK